MDWIEKALRTELKHLPIPVLIFYSDHPQRVERLIQLFKKQGNDTEVNSLERMEWIRAYRDQHHQVPEYMWDEDGYPVNQW
jgi:hypothetical protein